MVDYNDKIFKFENKINSVRYFNYDFLNLISSNLEINLFYKYLSSIIEYKLKNIWNHIVLKWIQSKKKIKSKSYFKSNYYKQNYEFKHNNIDDFKLNELLNDFINDDIFKAIFVVECINCL